jgi:YegS/Rv2252/BmrU family lipid kinase
LPGDIYMQKKTWFAIVNPASANGRTGKEWPKIHRLLLENNIKVDFAITHYPGEATLLTGQALRNYNRILAVGGDGTVNEVVNGFFENKYPINPEASLAILSHGTGGDFLRTINLKRGFAPFLETIHRERIVPIDCGQVQYINSQGTLQNRYFLNVADVGLGGETVARVNRHNKFFGGKISFLIGSLISILVYRNRHIKCIVDGELVSNNRINSIMVANGRYIGGGMMIAPNAEFTDGYFDIIMLGDFSTLQLLYHLPKIYQGKHLNVPGVAVYRGKDITIQSDPPALLDLDGEQPGCTPVHFSIISKGIKIWT